MDLYSFTLDSLEAAGVIGGYVAISIIGVTLLTLLFKDKIKSAAQVGPKWAQPVIGALLGVIPGCGGTIIVATLYKNKQLSFGALFAAFIVTLGEGSFVLLGASDEADVAGNLTALAIVNAVGFVTGTVLGYVVDALRIRVQLGSYDERSSNDALMEPNHPLARGFIKGVGFYTILVLAVFLAPGSIMALWGGGIDSIADLTVWVAIALTLLCMVYYLVFSLVLHKQCCIASTENMRSALLDAVADLAMVVFYVFIGLFIVNFIIDVVVGPEQFDAWMASSALQVVLLAALIGVTPGCGGMIAVAAAFVTIPNFPMAALIAAAIATSGDGIFPLIAQNKKDALLISVAGFATALVVGYAALALGI